MSRAYIAGIGTTGVIVAATLLLLAVVSALVAFRGLPEQDAPDPIRAYVVDDPSEPAAQRGATASGAAADAAGAGARPTPAAPSDPSAPAADADAGAADGGGALRTEPAPARETPPVPPDEVPTPDPVAPPGENGEPDAQQPDPPDEPQRPPTGVDALSRTLGDTSDRLTTGIGSVLAPISPALGAQVQATGDALADQIRRLGLSR